MAISHVYDGVQCEEAQAQGFYYLKPHLLAKVKILKERHMIERDDEIKMALENGGL